MADKSVDTRAEVRRVAGELLANGEKPTVDKVIGILKHGSRTTIHDELRIWWKVREKTRDLSALAALPEDLAHTMVQLWDQAVGAAEARHATEKAEWEARETEFRQSITRLEATLAQAATDLATQRSALQGAAEKNQQLAENNQHLEEELVAAGIATRQSAVRVAEAEQQIGALQIDLKEQAESYALALQQAEKRHAESDRLYLQRIDDARQETRRAEESAAKEAEAARRLEVSLREQIGELRTQLASAEGRGERYAAEAKVRTAELEAINRRLEAVQRDLALASADRARLEGELSSSREAAAQRSAAIHAALEAVIKAAGKDSKKLGDRVRSLLLPFLK
jgi:chromosome segregation ATPase